MMGFESTDFGKLMLRLAIAIIMFPHGLHKVLNGHEEIKAILSKNGLPEFLWVGVPCAEFIAPILLVLGLWVRPAAVLIAATMLMSIYLVYRTSLVSLNQFGGIAYELNLLLVLTSLALFFLGSGKYGISRGQGLLQ